ncbi:MAG: caspase family protein [Oscillatoriales cyanobacterium C42_A2020_001]|nr:caspase family protein [Leptolyngbyaceae cyanobacterium C42_A2020_001]
MTRHWAIAIGIEAYLWLDYLPTARQDAVMFRALLLSEQSYNQIYCFANIDLDNVLDEGIAISSQPTFANLKEFLQLRFITPFLNPGDVLWFFFSGHGLHFANRDYLMLSDSKPDAPEHTAIALEDLVECLRRSGTNNIVLLLDACRTEYQQFGQGFGTDPVDVVTVFASDFNQTAQSIDELHHGSFTYVLLEGLRSLSEKDHPNLQQLYQYLCDRIPQLNRQYAKPSQSPRLRDDAPTLSHAIPIPPVSDRDEELLTSILVQQHLQEAAMGNLPLW